ncbi:hypothetical protein Sango_1580600 [Sesamum angolense]|uniref:YqgF/RNase H-like domain-containing protein n=1 Tax=Sesamum angolense TaxID=2727404 RepID=A0AAE1WQ53_9LAMI|nr:hypothetical protein Sango_1580600 [Sesamum angolense]
MLLAIKRLVGKTRECELGWKLASWDGHVNKAAASVSVPWEEQIPPNALRRKRDPSWRGGFSLGVDLGLSRTGVALSKGFSIRPLTVLELRGQKLELRLLDIAEKQEVDEFIIGLPKSGERKETEQSNKVRSVAGRLAVRAAERGLSRSAREGRIDAYAAVYCHISTIFAFICMLNYCRVKELLGVTLKVLERYFSYLGKGIELVVPKQVELQNKLLQGPPKDVDFFPDD